MQLLLLAVGFFLQPVLGWGVGYGGSADILNGSASDPYLFRWSAQYTKTNCPNGNSVECPDSFAASYYGLRGGISYAIDPDFCNDMLEKFPEENELSDGWFLWPWSAATPQFVDCKAVERALRLSFAAWEQANSNIRFFDVSSLCTANKWRSSDAQRFSESSSETCDIDGPPCKSCEYAELIISAYKPSSGKSGSASSARTLLETDSSTRPLVAQRDYKKGGWLRGDVSTNVWEEGFPPLDDAHGHTINSAALQFSVSDDQCWYLDPDWCDALLRWRSESGVDLEAFIRAMTQMCIAFGVIIAVFITFKELYTTFQLTALSWDTDGDGVVEAHEVLEAVRVMLGSMALRVQGQTAKKDTRHLEGRAALYGVLYTLAKVNVFQFVVVCLLVIVPQSFEAAIFKPCWECDDIRSASAIQLGKVLGLTQLDVSNATSMSASSGQVFEFVTNRSTGYDCSAPSASVSAVAAGAPRATSIMAASSFRSYPRRTCPYNDDADALRVLYPECEQLLECEYQAGSNSSCARYTGPYSIVDAYVSRQAAKDASNANYTATDNYTVWEGLPSGRAVADVKCVDEFRSEMGRSGPFRAGVIFFQDTLPPLLVVLFVKLLAFLILLHPCMKQTRLANERLLRTAAKRKAEVRRMTEGGQEFAVKRVAKVQGGSTQEAVKKLKMAKEDVVKNATDSANVAQALMKNMRGSVADSAKGDDAVLEVSRCQGKLKTSAVAPAPAGDSVGIAPQAAVPAATAMAPAGAQ